MSAFKQSIKLLLLPIAVSATQSSADEFFAQQWNLKNTGQVLLYKPGGIGSNFYPDPVAGHDINLGSVHDKYTGQGIVFQIFDDGTDYTHYEFENRYVSQLSRDLFENDTDPFDSTSTIDCSGRHGTGVTGIALAGDEGQGIVGISPNATFGLIRIVEPSFFCTDESDFNLDGEVTEEEQADALVFGISSVDIQNHSYGVNSPYAEPKPLVEQALDELRDQGRGGLGTLVFRSAGNQSDRDPGYESPKNNRSAIIVGASFADGTAHSFTSPGSIVLVNAPGGQNLTTDVLGNSGTYGNEFFYGGDYGITSETSAASPHAAGMAALLLEARPTLNYREVQAIMALTATPSGDLNDWMVKSNGIPVSRKLGYGRINVADGIRLTERWLPVQDQQASAIQSRNVNKSIIRGNPVNSVITVPENLRIESVTAHIGIETEVIENGNEEKCCWSDISLQLISPGGTAVYMKQAEGFSNLTPDMSDWRYISHHHNFESSKGDWTLIATDSRGHSRKLTFWSLEIHGTPIPDSGSDLPVQCSPVAVSGGSASGVIQFGVSQHGAAFSDRADAFTFEDITLLASIDSSASTDLVAVVRSGNDHLMLTENGLQFWDGNLDTLEGLPNSQFNQDEPYTLFNGRPPAGEYSIYTGFHDSNGDLFYCPDAMEVTVTN